MTTFLYITIALFAIISVFMILLILIQKGRGGGLASAFGGAGGNTAFGAKTGDVLTWATSVVFGIFLLLAIVMNLVANSVNAARVGGPAAVTTTSTPATNTPPTNTPPTESLPINTLPTNTPTTGPSSSQP